MEIENTLGFFEIGTQFCDLTLDCLAEMAMLSDLVLEKVPKLRNTAKQAIRLIFRTCHLTFLVPTVVFISKTKRLIKRRAAI